MALILEQLGRGLVPEPYLASVVLAGGLLSRLGSAAQREAFLAPMIEGRTSLALAYAERQSRYQTADCLTTAERDGRGWVLRGEKVWVLNGAFADQLIVVARTAGQQQEPRGLSFFVVDGGAPGLTRTPVPGMDGHLSGLLHFDGVHVGADRLLGEEGSAHAWLEWAIDRGAAAACAEGQGALQELFERTVAYLKQRQQFGVPIGTFQALQHRAADMYAEVELCRSTMLLAAIQADHEDAEERKADVSAAKLQLAHGGWFIQENAIQLHGGIGVTDEQDEGLFFKRVRVLQALFGDADYHVDRFQRLPRFEA
jgi:alkylation response protein AidB-like acyl-CoA dehydrogenase